jgi:hypothetical protein
MKCEMCIENDQEESGWESTRSEGCTGAEQVHINMGLHKKRETEHSPVHMHGRREDDGRCAAGGDCG